MSDPLFVYGTLMTGETRASILGDLRRVPATCTGMLYDLPAGYPALDPTQEGRVHGELVEAPPAEMWGVLDLYEGVGQGLYRRVKVDVRLGMRRILAWSYVMDRPWERGGRVIANGRWKRMRRR